MTDAQLKVLREAAIAAMVPGRTVANLDAFRGAATPAKVFALLDTLDERETELKTLREIVRKVGLYMDMTRECADDENINDVEDEIFRAIEELREAKDGAAFEKELDETFGDG